MNRRGFLGAILAAAAAPAIVRADSLMRIVPRDLLIQYDDTIYLDQRPLYRGIVANMREDQAAYNRMVSAYWIEMIGGGGGRDERVIKPTPLLLSPGRTYTFTVGR